MAFIFAAGGTSQQTITTVVNNALSSSTFVTAAATGAVSGMTIVPGGLPGTATAPVLPDARGASNWQFTVAGATGTVTNAADATLGYNGIRIRCAPAAQCLARMNYGPSAGITPGLARILTGGTNNGSISIEIELDVIRSGVTDAFHVHFGIVSNYSSVGGFLALYCSDVSANWQLAFLSNTAAYNFPFPVPQRLTDTGVLAVNGGPHLLNLTATTELLTATIDGNAVASFDFNASPPSALEFAVLTGQTGPVPAVPQVAVSKAAGADTVDAWIPDGRLRWEWTP